MANVNPEVRRLLQPGGSLTVDDPESEPVVEEVVPVEDEAPVVEAAPEPEPAPKKAPAKKASAKK